MLTDIVPLPSKCFMARMAVIALSAGLGFSKALYAKTTACYTMFFYAFSTPLSNRFDNVSFTV
jgi:hypothetical protein